jgi:hypothetical protein
MIVAYAPLEDYYILFIGFGVFSPFGDFQLYIIIPLF